MDLKKYITDKSKEIGIDIIGFTDAEQFEAQVAQNLNLRREKLYETEFEEQDIRKRVDPKQILPSGKTIIVIGVSYYTDVNNKSTQEKKAKGKLSKSSLGLDYHIVLTEKMEKLVEEIKKLEIEFESRIGVDTTPILDRYLAKKAGIGWQGKNSIITNEKYGSFIFLGYIITNLEIEKDEGIEEQCGDCNMCIKSCPVGAIKPNYELNARRCISYLTQTKEDIPYNLRDKIENKIYGCDTCQQVCPKNKEVIKDAVAVSDDNLFEYIDIEELFSMSNKQFKNKYGNIAFSWRGKNVIKRNALINLGNLKDKDNIPLLEKALKDESIMIRKYSAWAILKTDQVEGLKILENHKNHEKEEIVIREIENLEKYFTRS